MNSGSKMLTSHSKDIIHVSNAKDNFHVGSIYAQESRKEIKLFHF